MGSTTQQIAYLSKLYANGWKLSIIIPKNKPRWNPHQRLEGLFSIWCLLNYFLPRLGSRDTGRLGSQLVKLCLRMYSKYLGPKGLCMFFMLIVVCYTWSSLSLLTNSKSFLKNKSLWNGKSLPPKLKNKSLRWSVRSWASLSHRTCTRDTSNGRGLRWGTPLESLSVGRSLYLRENDLILLLVDQWCKI